MSAYGAAAGFPVPGVLALSVEGSRWCRTCFERSELRAEQSADVVQQFHIRRTGFEFLPREWLGMRDIVGENLQILRCYLRIQHAERHLVVDAEGPVVEIGRANRHMDAVHDHAFAVVHRGLVEVE